METYTSKDAGIETKYTPEEQQVFEALLTGHYRSALGWAYREFKEEYAKNKESERAKFLKTQIGSGILGTPVEIRVDSEQKLYTEVWENGRYTVGEYMITEEDGVITHAGLDSPPVGKKLEMSPEAAGLFSFLRNNLYRKHRQIMNSSKDFPETSENWAYHDFLTNEVMLHDIGNIEKLEQHLEDSIAELKSGERASYYSNVEYDINDRLYALRILSHLKAEAPEDFATVAPMEAMTGYPTTIQSFWRDLSENSMNVAGNGTPVDVEHRFRFM